MKYHLLPLLVGAWLAAAASGAAYAADGDPSSVHFDIKRFEVRGNTLLPPETVDSLVSRFTGKDRDFADVMGALEALETAYHARGYQLVRIDLPEQELDQGVVTLNVVQIKIARVKIEGNNYFGDANIRRALPALNSWEAPNMQAISKSLKLANENPARKIVMSMQSAEQDDQVDATLAVTDETPWSATLNVDNTGSEQTGKTHTGVVLQNANMFGLDHVLSLQYTTTVEKPGSIKVYGAGYHVPLYELGDSLDFFGSYSNVNAGTIPVQAGILDIGVTGKGTTFGTRYNRNLQTVGNYESKLVYGADYKAYKNGLQFIGPGLSDGPSFSDITVHPVSIAYQGSWGQIDRSLGFGLTFTHNIPGGSRGGQQDFTAARFGAADDYNTLRFDGSLVQALPSDWQLHLALTTQYTNDALIPGEQFGAGGSTSVRGFQEREVSSDSGAVGNLEIYTPPLCTNNQWQCKMLAFYDRGYVTRNHALPGEILSQSLSSIGVGVRMQFRKNVDLQMDYGHVLQAQSTLTQRGDNRLHARLSLTF
ncbi:ShlB/FhaC/HecB family hemolysin secretion/activation protein [Oxalobacteraceae bacterium CAVE-383]|nr:ShlB/FhaC/HecB family hemolysin secretion/activation protein [Oxalobacteraceae bacterium CAVE-383]